MRDNKWPNLETLAITNDHLPEGFDSKLAEVLEGGAGSNLGEIKVSCDSFDTFRGLVHVLLEGACPKLQSLSITLKNRNTAVPLVGGGPTIAFGRTEDTCVKELSTCLCGRGVRLTYHRPYYS